jgi:hypothetical protein
MERVGIAKTAGNEQVFPRFGLMRAQVSLGHSIDLGICGVLIGTFILVLGPTVGKRWNDPLSATAICAAGAMVVASVSFTGFSSLMLAFVLLWLFTRPRAGPVMAMVSIVALILTLAVVVNIMINTQIADERPSDQAEASLWIRIKIMHDAWDIVADTGPFGSGKYLETTRIGSGSVDNAYLLFIMQNGWVYLGTWVLLALAIGWTGMRTLARANGYSERFPVAAAMAGTVATLMAMFTVFYGFVYGLLFMVLVGMLATMSQLIAPRAVNVQRGFDVMQRPYPRGMPVGGHR